MNNKNVIIAGAIAVGLYLFSQTKTTAQKVAQKVAPKRIGQPTTWLAFIAAKRKAAARKAAIRKAAARKIAQKLGKRVAQKVAPKRIGQPTTQAARIAAARKAAARKAAIRKAAARKIGKKIGKTVAQKIFQKLKIRRAVIAQHAKRQRPQIQRPRPNKKQIASRLFSGAEKSRIIPYSESSRHSYYGPKSHKIFNKGYRVEYNKRLANSVEANHDRVVREVLSNPKLWKK